MNWRLAHAAPHAHVALVHSCCIARFWQRSSQPPVAGVHEQNDSSLSGSVSRCRLCAYTDRLSGVYGTGAKPGPGRIARLRSAAIKSGGGSKPTCLSLSFVCANGAAVTSPVSIHRTSASRRVRAGMTGSGALSPIGELW